MSEKRGVLMLVTGLVLLLAGFLISQWEIASGLVRTGLILLGVLLLLVAQYRMFLLPPGKGHKQNGSGA